MAANLLTFEGIVENGQVRLADATKLPEGAHVLVVVAENPRERVARIYSPRLKDRTQLDEFEMEVVELDNEI